jgi:hypothetical protein
LPWGELALNTAALLFYPGLLTCALFGILAETIAARALGSGGVPWAEIRSAARRGGGLPPLASAAALLTTLAASQLALRFNPVAPSERNLLVAAAALISAFWLSLTWSGYRPRLDPRLVLTAQACWLAAVLGPALASESLRPQVLGAVLLAAALPLKVVAGLLFLLCLPVLLQLVGEAAPQGVPGAGGSGSLERTGFVIVRTLLWLPLCGLFASLFVPLPDDAVGLARSVAATGGAAAIAILAAAALNRWPLLPVRLFYFRVAAPLALIVLLLAGLAEAYPQAL